MGSTQVRERKRVMHVREHYTKTRRHGRIWAWARGAGAQGPKHIA